MIEATSALLEFQNKWFPKKQQASSLGKVQLALAESSIWPPLAEHPVEIERIKAMLSYVSSDCSYEKWRNIVWAVLSTGWGCAEQLALGWSQTAPERFNESAYCSVVNSFDPDRGISLGSLVHYAREAGYTGIRVESAGSVTAIPSVGRYSFQKASELHKSRPLKWRIKKLLPETGIGAIFGPSGSGKTFLAFDMAACIALGRPFYGRKVVRCPVVYVALEGGSGVSQRVQAWEKQYGQNLPDSFRVMTDELSLLNTDALGFAEALNEAGLSGGVVIIDTLNQSAPGADENSPSDMGKIISNAMVVQRLSNSLVLLVHHTGKDVSKGMRGHSSLVAAMDVTIKVERKVSGREWSVDKLKDGEDSLKHPFKLNLVELGFDDDDDPISSCVAMTDVFRISKPNPPTGKHQVAVFSALKIQAIASNTTYEEAVQIAYDAIPVDAGKHRKERAIKALETLIAGGYLVRNGDALEIA